MSLNSNNKIKILTDFKSKLEMFNLDKKKMYLFKKNNLNIEFEFVDINRIKKKYEADIYWGTKINMNILKRCHGLKWIHLGSAGYDMLNLELLKKKKILLSNSRGINADAVSNLVIFFLIDTSRKILMNKHLDIRTKYEQNFRECKDLNHQKVCILGYGRISKKLKSFLSFSKISIDIISKRKLKNKNVKNLKAFNTNIKNYDTIVNLLPLNNLNRNFLNLNLFNKMKINVNLILVGRSKTVNIHDLFKFLIKNKKASCYLDALPDDINKMIFKKLKRLKNIFITSHIGGYFRNYWEDQISIFKHNLLLFMKGKKIKNLV